MVSKGHSLMFSDSKRSLILDRGGGGHADLRTPMGSAKSTWTVTTGFSAVFLGVRVWCHFDFFCDFLYKLELISLLFYPDSSVELQQFEKSTIYIKTYCSATCLMCRNAWRVHSFVFERASPLWMLNCLVVLSTRGRLIFCRIDVRSFVSAAEMKTWL